MDQVGKKDYQELSVTQYAMTVLRFVSTFEKTQVFELKTRFPFVDSTSQGTEIRILK